VDGCSVDDGVLEIDQNFAKDGAPVGRIFMDDEVVQLAVLAAEDICKSRRTACLLGSTKTIFSVAERPLYLVCSWCLRFVALLSSMHNGPRKASRR
jgi:hypothetical protein